MRSLPIPLALGVGILAASAACVDEPVVERAFCFEDSNCADDETCVADLTLQVSYCARRCSRDVDCPASQRCQLGTPERATPPELRLCVDRVRACADAELCNGLDDDCDGVIDGPGCAPVTACLDDAPCGAFVCSAPPNQPIALCLAPNAAEPDDGKACSADADCRNGVCETGRCGRLCRPESTGQSDCPTGRVCARGVGPGLRPDFNQCQEPCLHDGECSGSERCAWRSVYQDAEDHHSVCTTPDPGRKPVGEFCMANDPEFDDQCQSGLCFNQQCARFCGGPGTDCSDVSATAFCCLVQLRYGVSEFSRYTCVEPGTPCG